MIFHENRLPADDPHEISCLICYFRNGSKILNCCLLQIIGGALRVKSPVARSGHRTSPDINWTNTGYIMYHTKCMGKTQIPNKIDKYRTTFTSDWLPSSNLIMHTQKYFFH